MSEGQQKYEKGLAMREDQDADELVLVRMGKEKCQEEGKT
jgi:hypothetical protein